jgi:hypothetical protein
MISQNNLPCPISVVIVSDYEAESQKTWKDEKRILRFLAQQDLKESFEVILVENHKACSSIPDELYQIYPHIRIVFTDEDQSAKLKDNGVRQSTTEFIAVLEADCLPNPEWLSSLYSALKLNKDFAVASGRTTYGDETMYQRCLSLLDRSFDNPGQSGETLHISNNGALYRRSILVKFLYPEAITPFQSSRMRIKNLREAGHKFYFEPKAVMRHAIGGLDFIQDFRRNTGYADMMEHSLKKQSEIPKLLWKRFTDECSDSLRLGPRYLNWYDWPLLLFLSLVVPFLGIPGMLDAIHERENIPHSSYR